MAGDAPAAAVTVRAGLVVHVAGVGDLARGVGHRHVVNTDLILGVQPATGN